MDEALSLIYLEEERKSLIYITLCHLLSCSRFQLHEQFQANLPYSQQIRMEEITSDLLKHKPIQYILGKTEFYGLPFNVGPGVLIPRPETEELVQWIITGNKHRPGNSFLDVGTGSGCIAIALARNLPGAEVFALDHSPAALAYAAENARLNQVNIHFIEQDFLAAQIPWPRKFDVVVSNPPYVPVSEQESMLPNVLGYEPHEALFVPDRDPLLFYGRIAESAPEILKPGGSVYCEIHEIQGREIPDLFRNNGFGQAEIKKDINGKERMFRAIFLP